MGQSNYVRGAVKAAAVIGVAALVGIAGISAAQAQKTVKVGITVPLTGADAEDATLIKNGAMMAFDEANAKNEIPGYKLEVLVYDNGTATAGQYDPAQAATNTKKLAADPMVVANVGPQMSGDGKAMSPILSEADLATITPSSTNPDITDPAHAAQYRPKGKAVYFRTVTTDAYQGPNMANFVKDKLHVKSVYILDDSGAYGVGLADAFQKQAEKIGIKVLGRDQLNPKEADYTTVLTKIKAANPDLLYYGGVAQAGVKLAKQAYDVVPKMLKAGGDGVQGASFFTGVGFPAVEGWYSTTASPELVSDPKVAEFVKNFTAKYGKGPNNYAITSYDAGKVIIAAIKKVIAEKKPVDKANVRDAIETTHMDTLQGPVAFDKNGDILNKVVSVYEYKRNPSKPADDVDANQVYVGVAPESPQS
ncbi:MAG TPA: branched-chain amino acid ABC transporter substrate-binding protein [Stellaceae bacterium]|nr:branched-chain amino acid ABC transporter substrate-binding protein [Stellaceae bacterium]